MIFPNPASYICLGGMLSPNTAFVTLKVIFCHLEYRMSQFAKVLDKPLSKGEPSWQNIQTCAKWCTSPFRGKRCFGPTVTESSQAPYSCAMRATGMCGSAAVWRASVGSSDPTWCVMGTGFLWTPVISPWEQPQDRVQELGCVPMSLQLRLWNGCYQKCGRPASHISRRDGGTTCHVMCVPPLTEVSQPRQTPQ